MRMYELSDKLFEILDNGKTISKAKISVVEFKRFCFFVDSVNDVKRKSQILKGSEFRLTDYLFPELFKDFLLPDSVSMGLTLEHVDYLSRPSDCEDGTFVIDTPEDVKIKGLGLFTPYELESFSARVYGMYRATTKNITILDIKKPVTLKDSEFPRYYLAEGKLCRESSLFPIPLNIPIFEDDYLYVSVETQTLRCFQALLESLRTGK